MCLNFFLPPVIWGVLAKHPVPSALSPGVGATVVNLPLGEPPIEEPETHLPRLSG